MLTKNKKTALIIALAVSSFLLAISNEIYFLYAHFARVPLADWIHRIDYYKWDWLPVLCLAGYGLKLTRGWNPGSKLLKVVVFIVLLTAIALGVLSLYLLIWAYMAFGYDPPV